MGGHADRRTVYYGAVIHNDYIIIVVVAIAVILAVRNPIKKLEKTSIVDIISVQ